MPTAFVTTPSPTSDAPSGSRSIGELHELYPHLTTVGEVYNGSPVVTSFFAGGVVREGIDTGLTTPFDFPIFFALRNALSHH